MPRAHSWMVFGLLTLLASASATGRKKATHFEGQQAGTVISVDAAGHFIPVSRATVQLKCIGPAELGKHFNLSCDSTLVVKRDGKELARADGGLLGVDYNVVAGNASNVTLELLPVGGASLIILRGWESKGDEQTRESAEDQLFVMDGTTLREVYRFQSLHSVDLGSAGDTSQLPASERRHTARLEEDGGRTLDVPNLVVRETSGEGDRWRSERVLVWNGKSYVSCAECRPTEVIAVPKPRPAAAIAPGPTAVLAEADPYKPAVPLLEKVYRGERLPADALKPLSDRCLAVLRNAPFARRGRPFKNPDLTQFFYGARWGPLPVLQINPAFQETMLDDSDRANVATVLAELRRRKANGAAAN